MIRTIALSGALVFALSGAAFAQTDDLTAATTVDAATPATGSQAWAARGAVMALRGAYRAIADAQELGASPYLDAAKTHYRGALARYAKADPGAASEAMAAAALARAAVAEHPAPVPRDIPAPPEMTAMEPAAGTRMPMAGGMHRAGMMGGRPGMAMRGGPWMHRGHGGGRFDATRVAADAKLAGTAEAKDLAQKALDADVARSKAAFAGNTDEAMRDGRLAGALAMAVRSLAYAEHPRTYQRRSGTPGAGWSHRDTGGVVGGTGNS
jgi:hypothetical protein